MTVTLTPSPLAGAIRAIPSKSFAHRLLLASALADRPTDILCPSDSEDIRATADCLRALGAEIEQSETGFLVKPLAAPAPRARLDCGESGTTLRFLLPVTAVLGGGATFLGHGRLPGRPLSSLYELLAAHGLSLTENGRLPLTLSGKLGAGDYAIAAHVSSQFIGGLLTALPLAVGDSTLTLTGRIESAPYIQMTLNVLTAYGADIRREDNTFFIRGIGRYRSPGIAAVEGDWSNAAFWLVAGALTPEGLRVDGLSPASAQGDRRILSLLRAFGAEVEEVGESVTVRPGRLHGLSIAADDIPDLVPILSVLAAAAEGETLITGAARLRFKESDRLAAVRAMLTALGAPCEEREDGLRITGVGALRGGTVSSFRDHRIAMSAAVASLLCRRPVTIEDADAVAKSYPAFFSDLTALGGRVERV